MSNVNNIGIDVKLPTKECEDDLCPFHGTLPVRGRIIEGIITSDKMQKSVVVRRNFLFKVKKYDRYETRHGKVTARLPECLDAKQGDAVKVMECRPLSRSISFVVIEKLDEKH